MSSVAANMYWAIARATNGWVVSWKDAHNKPKTVGEILGVKGRNPIELVCYKRKVTKAEKEDQNEGEKIEEEKEKQGKREKHWKRETQWREALKGGKPMVRE